MSFSGEKVRGDTHIHPRPNSFLSNAGTVSERKFFQIGPTLYSLVMRMPAVKAGEVASMAQSV
jgi:hypothetical protein